MFEPVFRSEQVPSESLTDQMAKCKCGRCTRTDEKSDASMASSDLGGD